MKKICIILSLIICIILTFIVGVNIGKKETNKTSELNNVVGIYHSYSWNNKEATLVINSDGTCKYPTGKKGTWQLKDEVIEINLGKVDYSEIYNGGTITDDIHNATIVNNGVLLHSVLFNKIK